MKKIEFTKEERTAITGRIQRYFADELEFEIGNIPAELVLGFFSEEIGGYFYNRGLYDAQAVFRGQLDAIDDSIYALEQRETLKR